MKALVITTAPPDANTQNQTGGTNWTLRLLRLLDRHHKVTLLAPPPLVDPFLKQADFPQIECPPDDQSGKCARFIKSLRWKIYPSMWHQRSSTIDRFLSRTTQDSFEVCWLLDDYAGMYLREIPKGLPVVFCRHFVLNMGLPDKSTDTRMLSALKLGWHRRIATAFDKWTTKRSDVTITGTQESRANLLQFEPDAKIIYLPTKPYRPPPPVAMETIAEPTRGDGRITAVFLGDMSFPRNEEAVHWLAQEVLPTLAPEQRAALHFKFIGKKNHDTEPPLPVPSGCSIEFTGFVDDLTSHLAEAQCAVIPVFGGNGVRIKTVTLLGSGLPAVSTTDGVEGLPLDHNKEVIIANDPKAFASGLIELLDEKRRKELSQNCRVTMNDFNSGDKDAETLLSISEQIA